MCTPAMFSAECHGRVVLDLRTHDAYEIPCFNEASSCSRFLVRGFIDCFPVTSCFGFESSDRQPQGVYYRSALALALLPSGIFNGQ